MGIKVPPDAVVVRDARLNLIRVLSVLTAEGGRLDQLKNDVKKTLEAKGARFAESDLVIADLRGGGGGGGAKSFVDPRKLFALVESKRIRLENFLDVICVRTSLLPPLLSGIEIAAISKPAENKTSSVTSSGALYTEFKEGTRVDLDAIERAMLEAILPTPGDSRSLSTVKSGIARGGEKSGGRGGKSAA